MADTINKNSQNFADLLNKIIYLIKNKIIYLTGEIQFNNITHNLNDFFISIFAFLCEPLRITL